jgi:hypothetical protein
MSSEKKTAGNFAAISVPKKAPFEMERPAGKAMRQRLPVLIETGLM